MKIRKNFIGQDGFQWWIGVVEDRNDPEKLGRCRVRIFGIHTSDLNLIPSEDLPWAIPVYSINNSGTFSTPKEGEYVIGFYLDGSYSQSPAILGVLPGINQFPKIEDIGFNDLRNAEQIRNSPQKPSSIDYPESKTGYYTNVSGNIVNDGVGIIELVINNIIIHLPLSLSAKPSLTDDQQNIVGYSHKFTQSEINTGFIDIPNNDTIIIRGLNGANTTITEVQARALLNLDVISSLQRAEFSIESNVWNTLNATQKAGLTLNAYHMGTKTDFRKSGVQSAIISNNIVGASQLLSADMLRSSTGKYIRSEDGLAHAAANLFKSIPRSEVIAARANTLTNITPMTVAGSGVGVQVFESNLSEDSDAKSLNYPTADELGKSTLSDLITNTDKTIIQKFRERSLINALGANDESWAEPNPINSTEYPFNKVTETESGHVIEMDDTPLMERVHIAHRAGSFVEWYPSGTKVEKIVKNNYKLIMSDDHLYVAGMVNIVLESNTNVRIVGNCNLQIENDLNAKISGNVNFSVADSFNIKANTLKFDIAQTSTIMAATHSNTGTSIAQTSIVKRGSPTLSQKFLEADRVVRFSAEINKENTNILKKYQADPYKFPAAFKNVKQFIAPAPKSGSDRILKNIVGKSIIVLNETADIKKWLDKQLDLASKGYWRETGVETSKVIQPSNHNIIDLWRNLGFTREYWTLSDQTNWAMAFVNFGLKQNGYRYVQTPYSRDVELRIDDYRFVRVNPQDARAGDVVLWANDHVNFVYDNIASALRFVGAVQPPDPQLNLGDGRIGDVSIVTAAGCPIVTIVRPSKT